MTTITAKSILASRHALTGDRIDTLLLHYPRCVHSEVMTHRVFSRNASSSRAIPVDKLIQAVIDDPFVPLFWGKNQSGMQAGEESTAPVWLRSEARGGIREFTREEAWLDGMWKAIEVARAFQKAGYHKQIVNRIYEPYAHINVVATGTNWSNFLALRDHPAAEPHIQILAREVRKALENAEVQTLRAGEWHLPFVGEDEGHGVELPIGDLIKLSVARCASTSYKTADGFDMTLERAIALHDKLVGSVPLHASPCEHPCFADEVKIENRLEKYKHPELHGNFVGFCQYRKQLPGECQ